MKSLVIFKVFLDVVRVPKSRKEMAGTCGKCVGRKRSAYRLVFGA
jgi:hypothetical protein